MRIIIDVEAPISEAQSAKELLAMRLEHIGKVKVVQIQDDGFNKQEEIVMHGR